MILVLSFSSRSGGRRKREREKEKEKAHVARRKDRSLDCRSLLIDVRVGYYRVIHYIFYWKTFLYQYITKC